jgi:hypothetical protein
MDWENETINFACLGLEEIRALQCGVGMIAVDAVSDDIRAEIDLATKEPDYHETGQGKLQRMERICGGVDFPTGKLPELLPVADAVLASKGILKARLILNGARRGAETLVNRIEDVKAFQSPDSVEQAA